MSTTASVTRHTCRTPPILTGRCLYPGSNLGASRFSRPRWSMILVKYLFMSSLTRFLFFPIHLIRTSPEVFRPSRPDYSHIVSFISFIHRDRADKHPSNVREQCWTSFDTTDGRQESEAKSSAYRLASDLTATHMSHTFGEEGVKNERRDITIPS